MSNGQTQADYRRLHAVIHGRVQGVNFRAMTQHTAAQHHLTGWVRNLPDDTVEAVAEGPLPALEAFEQFLHQGPRAAQVERVEVRYSAATGEFHSFSIRF